MEDRIPPAAASAVEEAHEVRTESGQPAPIAVDNATVQTIRTEQQARYQRRLRIMFPFLMVIVALVYAFTTNFIPSDSMLPNIRPGDHVLTMRAWLAYLGHRPPARGDIVIFQLPGLDPETGDINPELADNPDAAGDEAGGRKKLFLFRTKGEVLIKRVVGLPGETIQLVGNDVYIDGRKLNRPYRTLPVDLRTYLGRYGVDEPLKLGPDEVFVMGDNGANSEDSRFWGPLKRSNIIGRYMGILFHESEKGPNEKIVHDQKAAAEER